MAELRKFLFDNFVIEDKKKAQPIPEPIEPEEEIEALPEAEPEPAPIEVEPEPMVEEAEPEPEIITFTEEEVAEKVKNAEQEAFEKGYKAAQESIEQNTKELLETINTKLIAIIANSNKAEEKAEHEVFTLAKAVVDKLVPGLNDEYATEIVNKFIKDNFNSFKNESKLSFYIHPDIISYVQETIAKLANSYDFEGKISLHKDAGLGKADCRIEWENGGVERNSAELSERVKDLLAEEPEGKNENE